MAVHQDSLHADRLIIATNRGPIEYLIGQDKALKHRRGSGGVVTALLGTIRSQEATWVALAMTEGDRRAVQEAHNGVLPSPLKNLPVQLHYVSVPRSVYRKHYETICNQVLWFLQHYLSDRDASTLSAERLQDAWDAGYVAANQAIADAVCAEIERESTPAVVTLHDYQLYLAPAVIRQRHQSVVMQHFIHIPWPEVRYWQSSLPGALSQAIFQGLLGNDIIGFQTERDASNFLEGVQELLQDAAVERDSGTISWQGRQVLVRAYPISISVSDERRVVKSVAGRRAAERIRPLLAEQTILRVDRIEPTKNIVRGFQAYQRLLEQHPELHGKVTFLAFLVPSRENVAIYKQYKTEILQSIEHVNQTYGHDNWQPIQYFLQNDRTQALAAMQWYDVLLVNALIDGMNLVAKEGPVVNQRDGVLVLSRTSGAFQQLEAASLPVSPADVLETSEVLYQALTLSPDERHQRAEQARQEVERHDLADWVAQQLEDLNMLYDEREGRKAMSHSSSSS